jgi:hypothetical protein
MGKPTPTAEQRRLVALWRGSTLSQSAFARSHDILPGTFASWVARHDRPVASAPSAFVEITAGSAEKVTQKFVVLLGDHALGFEAPPPPAWFAQVVRELASC